jgi:MoaA/NifB/PqqE/SkfB family radical SAM enzyme
MNFKAFLNASSLTCRTLPIVILYVTEGCNLRCMTCSYRAPLPNELTLPEIEELALRLKNFGLRHIVYSGGEPLMRRDLPQIGKIFQAHGVRQTLLTNGLLLEKRLEELSEFLNEIIISLDGPSAAVHDAIRGVESFERILRGIHAAKSRINRAVLSIRMVVQRRNFRSVPDMVGFAGDLGVDRISFLAADVLSNAFGREHAGTAAPAEDIRLEVSEAAEFRALVSQMIIAHDKDFRSGFISDPPPRLLHIARYFEALAGDGDFPPNVCNAPMMSTVISSTGDILPCYFLPHYGNLRSGDVRALLNSPAIRSTRASVREMSLERCKTCVCTLHVPPHAALLDRF